MDWWLILLIVGAGALLVLKAWLGPPQGQAEFFDENEEPIGQEQPELWDADALSRYGTETSIEQLVAEGRADELRGLGYEGDLPEQ